MKTIRHIILLITLALSLVSCVHEPWSEAKGDSDGWSIFFNATPSADVVVSTKGTMTDPKSENVIYNIYVLVFDKDENKVYGEYFDQSKIGTTDHHWEYTNTEKSAGKIHLRSAKSSSASSADCTIIMIANLNSEMVNITPDQLDHVANLAEMKTISSRLLQKITSRSGYFPMCGQMDHVNLSGSSIVLPDPNAKLELKRLDAKIEFKVRAEEGLGIYDFTPLTWQVVNIPLYSAVLPGEDFVIPEGEEPASFYFNGEANNFETVTVPIKNASDEILHYDSENGSKTGSQIPIHGFSFYMMENKKGTKPGKTPTGFKDRDVRSDGQFVYADDWATYVILTGRLVFEKVDPDDGQKHVNHAEVKYIIHLGNFGTDVKDFNVLRNHYYVYSITIEGVEQIRAEVLDTEHPEEEPGASGAILVPVRQIYTCDSHYNTIVLEFKYTDIQAGKMGWWVRTPFSDGVCSNGSGQIEDGSRVDCEWVEFRVNNKDTSTPPKYVDKTWALYKPRTGTNADGNTMTVSELMNYLLAQKTLYDNGDPSAFDNPSNPDKARILVTAFVNENYYESNPIEGNGDNDPSLWRKFVNAPMRTMCLLSSYDETYKESRVERATYIIHQYSIQSVYNINDTGLNSGWGAEYELDARESQDCGYNHAYVNGSPAAETRDNTNPDNGRRNSMIEWGLITVDAGADVFHDNLLWSEYVKQDKEDQYSYMVNWKSEGSKMNYQAPRYTCMSRNRDNNGNGKIDKDEIRWYMAASNQLINLFLGSYGLEGISGLYQRTPEQRNTSGGGVNTWRQHVMASNRSLENTGNNSNKAVRVVWAEEGFTGSWFENITQNAVMTARCVRNFGLDNDPETAVAEHNGDITYSPVTVAPDDLIIINRYHKDGREYNGNWDVRDALDDNNKQIGYKDVYFDVDCRRINEKSLRYYTDRELAPHDEFNEAACLYKHFQTTSIEDSPVLSSEFTVSQMNEAIDNNTQTFCPKDYRAPNVRELAVMCYFFNKTEHESEVFIRDAQTFDEKKYNQDTFARTKYSFGNGNGAKKFDSSHWGWGIGRDKRYKAFMAGSEYKTKSIRCVKDVKINN